MGTLRPRWLPLLSLLAGWMIVPSSVAGQEDAPPSTPILASFDFETATPTGPDTFRIFEHAHGRVDLSSSFRISGERSLRIREEPDNGCFSELLGFFPRRDAGLVFIQFYALFPDPQERVNFALAGPRWFLHYVQGGHAVWLATEEGRLRHRPAGEWQDLISPRPFTWYFFDLVYDVDAGEYDLAIYEEGMAEPLLDLRDQRNTADAHPSPIAYYSFIGDLEDAGSGTYYVDDLLVATDPEVRLKPFVAPGRRDFFVDRLSPSARRQPQPEGEGLIAEARRLLRRREMEGPLPQNLRERLERAADTAFQIRDLDLAEELYRRLSDSPEASPYLLLKLADIHHLRGDVAAERAAREAIYGRLELEEVRDAEERHRHP